MAKKGDKFFDKIRKDVRDIDHGKLKHHLEHHKLHEKKHEIYKKHETKSPIIHMIKHKRIKSVGEEIKSEHPKSNSNTEKILSENLVALQKIMANLALNIDGLSKRITKLLDLFEVSAKTLAEKDFGIEKSAGFEKELNQKMDTLIEHNKLFAKGLTLLHEKEGFEHPVESRPLPQTGMSPQPMPRRVEPDNYQKSISSKP